MSSDNNPSSHPYYRPPAQAQPYHQGSYHYEGSVQPDEGVKAAKASTLFGCIGIAAVILLGAFAVGAPAGFVLGFLGLKKAQIAEQHNVVATSGKVSSWVSIVLGGLLLILMGMILAFAFMVSNSS